jgi:hypothetical protein
MTTFMIHSELFNDSISAEHLVRLTVDHTRFTFRMYGALFSDQRATIVTRFFCLYSCLGIWLHALAQAITC